MELGQEGDRFLEDMNLTAKGYNPEVSRLVDELRLQQLGKPIVYSATPPSDLAQQRAVAALERMAGTSQPLESVSKKHEEELLGYILPVNPEQTRHLVILKDGIMLVTQANNTQPFMVDLYNSYFSVSETPFVVGRYRNLPSIVDDLSHGLNSLNCKTLFRNDKPTDVEQIDAAREQAIQVATQLREQRIRTKQETSGRLVESLRNLLFPPKPPQPDQPQ